MLPRDCLTSVCVEDFIVVIKKYQYNLKKYLSETTLVKSLLVDDGIDKNKITYKLTVRLK